MRVLVVLVHYFSPENDPRHASLCEAKRESRTAAIKQVIEGYRGTFGPPAYLRSAKRVYELGQASNVQIDLRLLTVQGCSLVDKAFVEQHGVARIFSMLPNPRYLGFGAYQIFEQQADDYDWYVYSEDDVVIRDPQFFEKLAWFNRTFGESRVLSPNRLEWNPAVEPVKTYIDPAMSPSTQEKINAFVPDETYLRGAPMVDEVTLRRAENPHSGFFAITRSQLKTWMARDYWKSQAAVLISPLESAATLDLVRTFSVYKPHGSSSNFLEIEHLEDRFSGYDWPRVRPEPATYDS